MIDNKELLPDEARKKAIESFGRFIKSDCFANKNLQSNFGSRAAGNPFKTIMEISPSRTVALPFSAGAVARAGAGIGKH